MVHEASMRKVLARNKMITWLMVGIQFPIGLVISVPVCLVLVLLTMLVSGASLLSFGTIMASLMGILVGLIIWTLILCNTKVFDMFFLNLRPNWSVLVRNQTEYDPIKEGLDKRTEVADQPSVRELGPGGFHGRLPWENAFESFDTEAEIVMGNGGDGDVVLKVYTKDNVELDLRWQVPRTPLIGKLANLARKSEKATDAFFRGVFIKSIRKSIGGHEVNEIFDEVGNNKLKDEFDETFRDTLGGPNHVSDEEIEYGEFTGSPQIISLERTAKFQEAAQAEKVSEHISGAVGKIRTQAGMEDADPNVVLATAAAAAGVPLQGIFIIPGFNGKESGKVLASMAALGAKIPGAGNPKDSSHKDASGKNKGGGK